MIPRFSPDYGLGDAVACLLPGRRSAVSQLEGEFARRTEHASAVAFRYGRSGLTFLLRALGAKNKKVVLPSYTCVVMAHAVVESGNEPVFLDNAPDRLQPDPSDYFDVIDEDTVMIVPTHLFGVCEETEELVRSVRTHHPSVFVLQDCAHSYFCRDRQGVTAASVGDGALFGMNISKLVNSVRGGMLTLAEPQLASQVRALRGEAERNASGLAQGLKARAYALAAGGAFTRPGYEIVRFTSKHTPLLEGEVQYFQEDEISLPKDFAGPMHPLEAEMGLRSLARLDERVLNRAQIATFYIAALRDLPGVWLPEFSEGHTWSHFPVLVPAEKRNEMRRALEVQCGTEIGVIVDYSVADLAAYQKRGHSSCPRALEAVDRVLNLPLTLREGLLPSKDWQSTAQRVVDCFRTFF